ncbi:MAG: FtsX-like permease family protein [Gammaproteobacteria bacterium]|nr:FtsX-like permease family protein [Gammaproteobacteria bacterium]
MTLLGLALADLRHRRYAQALHVLLMASGLALLVVLLGVTAQVGDRLDRNSRGIDAVVGAKGSPLQLILSAVHHLDVPTGTLPLDEVDRLARDPRVAEAIPIALGDNLRGYRIVGSTPALITHYGARLADGRAWQAPMEAVIGADVAASGIAIGDAFHGVHGLGSGRAHGGAPYRVVGVLARTGSVVDRLVLTGLDSIWALHAAPAMRRPAATAAPAAADDDDEHDDHHDGDPAGSHRVTAALIRYRSPIAALSLPREINERSDHLAAVPAIETARLLGLIGVGIGALKALAALLLAASALSLLVAMVQTLDERQHDLALFRSLGARRSAILWLLWLAAALPALLATVLGLALGHAGLGLLAAGSQAASSLALDPLQPATGEALLAALPLLLATLAVLGPAWQVYRSDVAATLARTRSR